MTINVRNKMTNKEFLKKLKIIGDPTRLTIIQILSKKGTMCACKILDELKITQGTLSYHMKILTKSGIVNCFKNGKWCNYSLTKESICEIALFLKDICNNPSINKDCSCHK